MSIRKAGQVIAGTPNITTGHHVGEIFWTSRLDNELNGAVDADGATYRVEAFTGEKSVPELLRKGSLPYVSMVEYESIVSAYGSCRAWGWDNGDTFRVPTLKDVYLMAGQAETAGEFISESLPNITGSVWSWRGKETTDFGGVAGQNDGKALFGKGGKRTYSYNDTALSDSSASATSLNFDASRSSSTYQDGAKVRPDSVRYRAMVQLSTGVKEDATQLKEYKFNNPHFFGQSMWTDVEPKNGSWLLSNGAYHSGATYVDYYQWLLKIHNGTETVDGVSVKGVSDEYTDYDFVINTTDTTFRLPLLDGSEDLPSDRYDNLTIESANSTYTAPANGWFKVSAQGWTSFEMNNTNAGGIGTVFGFRQDNFGRSTVEAKKGQEIRLAYSGTITNADFRFVYATGNGSLYFYVGDTLQDTNLIQTGEILDYFAKIDTVHCVVETFKSGSSWYRVYDDGWVEQGGQTASVAGGSSTSVTFLKPFSSADYTINSSPIGNYTASAEANNPIKKTKTGFTQYCGQISACPFDWIAFGYGA